MDKAIKILIILLVSITFFFIAFNFLLLHTSLWTIMPEEIQQTVVQFKLRESLESNSQIENSPALLLALSNDFDMETILNLIFDKEKPTEQRYLAIKTLAAWAEHSSPQEKEEVKKIFEGIIADKENPESLRLETLYVLKSIGQPTNLDILEAMAMDESTNSELRWSSLVALGESQNPPQALFLEKLKNDPDDTVRFKAAQTIWENSSPEIIPSLLDIAVDENNRPSTRDYAIMAIRNLSVKQEIKDEKIIEILTFLLEDKEYRVRVSAAEALLALTGEYYAIEPGTEEELFAE